LVSYSLKGYFSEALSNLLRMQTYKIDIRSLLHGTFMQYIVEAQSDRNMLILQVHSLLQVPWAFSTIFVALLPVEK